MAENNEVKKSGLATTSLVLGIIGIVLSFIPIINNIAFILGVLAIIFGIIPLIKKASKGKAIAGIILAVLTIVITLSMQSAVGKALDETSKELDKATGARTEEVLKTDVNVTLGNFEASVDEYGLVDSKLVVTVKNITQETKSYSIQIEAVDANGNRLEDGYVSATNLTPGQEQKFEIFTFITSDKVEAFKNATFKIVKVSVM